MRLNDKQIQRLVKYIFNDLTENNLVVFKTKEEEVYRRAQALVEGDFQREKDLDEEVHRMMDDLEEKNPGEFQRYKMFPLLKKKLAQQKGIVL